MLNPYAEYFGANSKYEREINPDDQLSHETYNLPEAYKGSNKHLANVLDFMIRKEDEFYTSKLLPWSYTDELHVQWEIFRFNRTLMDVEPEQGIPRLVTAETEARSDSLLRRGLAFIIEHGFMTTERGRRHFMLNLQQITDAVHTTAYYGVLHALLTSERHYKQWNRENSRLARRPRNLRKEERNRWAMVQKSHKGLYILDADIKHQMQQNGVTPNVWVFPSKMSIYLDMVPTEQTEYRLKGPKAAGNLEEDRSQSGIRWRGTEVFEAESFDIDFVNESQDLLQRPRQIGEFFIMKHTDAAIKIFSADHDEFKQITYADARFHCLNSDDNLLSKLPARIQELYNGYVRPDSFPSLSDIAMAHISEFKNNLKIFTESTTFKGYEGLNNLDNAIPCRLNDNDELVMAKTWSKLFQNVFAKITKLKAIDAVQKQTLENIDVMYKNFASYNYLAPNQFEAAMNISGNPEDIIINVLMYLEQVQEDLKGISSNKSTTAADIGSTFDILSVVVASIPYIYWFIHHSDQKRDIVIFRPFQTYRMSSAILAAGGADLGETFHGHHDFQLSDDIIRKVHVGHYTHYSKSVVKNPKRFAIAEDVFSQGYVSGEGIEFFSKDSLKRAISECTIGDSELSESLIAWSVPIGSADDLVACDITGKFQGRDEAFNGGGEDGHFYGSDDLADIINGQYANQMPEDDRFLQHGTDRNTVCFRGMQFSQTRPRKSTDGDYVKTVDHFRLTHLGNGHWKNLTYGGCMDVREGSMMNKQEKLFKLGEKL
jgi:hypothetical protein